MGALEILDASDLVSTRASRFAYERSSAHSDFGDAVDALPDAVPSQLSDALLRKRVLVPFRQICRPPIRTVRSRSRRAARSSVSSILRSSQPGLRTQLATDSTVDSEVASMIDTIHAGAGDGLVDEVAISLGGRPGLPLTRRALTGRRRIDFLVWAFGIRRAPELGQTLVDATMGYGDAIADSDPHAAVSLYEHLYLPRVPGLDVPDEVQEEARERVRQTLFPVVAENFRRRYERKFGEEDIPTGRYNPDAVEWTFEAYDDEEERIDAVATWVYHVFERPRPTPVPDFLAQTEECPDLTQTCVVGLEVIARWLHNMQAMENERAAELGVTLLYPHEQEELPE